MNTRDNKELSNPTKNQDLPVSTNSNMLLNDNKAGMQGIDKEKINKIIYEASKGSKYFENEKRKEERVNKRIALMQDKLLRVDEHSLKSALNESDVIYDQLSKQIDLSRTIVHVDMDAFYAAVEMRDDPKLLSVPMAVGDKYMLCTSNYLARKYGVRAAMPGFIAKKLCPQLVIIPTHFDKYKKASLEIQAIFSEYDSHYGMISLDEAQLDLTDYLQNNAYKYINIMRNKKDLIEIVVEELRFKIFSKTQLTASAGIAANTMLAKICSDVNKPNGQYYLKSDHEVMKLFMKDLPIRKVGGIGKVTEQMLKSLNVITCHDLYVRRNVLFLLFLEGSFHHFMEIVLAISSNRIEHGERKSMSVERTFQNLTDKSDLLALCESLCKHLADDLSKERLCGHTVSIKYKLSSFVTKTRSKSVNFLVFCKEQLFLIAKDLLLNEMRLYKDGEFTLRLLGVSLTRLKDQSMPRQKTVDEFFQENDSTWCTCPICGIDFSSKQIKRHADSCFDDSFGIKNKDNQEFPDAIEYAQNSSQAYFGKKTDILLAQCYNQTRKSIKESKTEKDSLLISTENQNFVVSKESTNGCSSVQCPVCNSFVQCDVNDHIDECLSRQTVKNLIQQSRHGDRLNKHNPKKRKCDKDIGTRKRTLYSFWKSNSNE